MIAAEFIENLLERKILAAQNVTLAAFAFLQRRQMTLCTFSYIDQIQAGIHIGGKLFLQEIDHNPSCRRGLDIAFAHRSCRIHHDDIHS